LIIVVGLIAIILAMAGGYLISRTISNPISKLKEAAIEIGQGDLSKRAQVESKDEVGVLAVSFNQMADEIQKRNEELQTMNEELQSANEELESSNEELRSTTEELEASNEELQSTTEELEASNEELRTANEELETTQEKLIQQEKLAAVGQLASGVGHELRNPLGVIKNAAYYIKTKVGTDDPKLAKHLTIMEREINNSNRIISDLLGFSRTRLPSIAPSDINKIVDSAMEVVEMPENVLLVKEFDASLPKAIVDPDQMHQVFVNLGLNAVQAMAEGGQLKVKTRLAGDYVEVEFNDTGCGIPQENLNKLFDPFFSTKARGVGLGLAVTHGIIERNKCKIEVESKVSEGTTFVVKLPIEKQTSEKEATDRQKVTVS
jgi:signal transduction histidine kinase